MMHSSLHYSFTDLYFVFIMCKLYLFTIENGGINKEPLNNTRHQSFKLEVGSPKTTILLYLSSVSLCFPALLLITFHQDREGYFASTKVVPGLGNGSRSRITRAQCYLPDY